MIGIDLSGKTALVTGSTGQLGRVMARTLAAAGADIALHYRSNQAKALELKAEIEALGRRALCVQADITSCYYILAPWLWPRAIGEGHLMPKLLE